MNDETEAVALFAGKNSSKRHTSKNFAAYDARINKRQVYQ